MSTNRLLRRAGQTGVVLSAAGLAVLLGGGIAAAHVTARVIGESAQQGLRAELPVERIAERVREVGRDHHRSSPALRTTEGRRGGDARLPDSALAGVEEDPAREGRDHAVRVRAEGQRPRRPW